jgi:glycosyltransferase involved in cell wall biosynthesis
MKSVLHVGNIAHNAYFNELILRKSGRFGCVVNFDAYHFASSPQWLKLSKQKIDRKSLGDDFFPNFFQFENSQELQPDFFFQGPLYQVLSCLYSLGKNNFNVNDPLFKSSRALMDFLRYKVIYKKNYSESAEVWDDKTFAQSLKDLNVHTSWIKTLNRGFGLDKYRYKFIDNLNSKHGLKLKLINLPLKQTYINPKKQTYINIIRNFIKRVSLIKSPNELYKIIFQIFYQNIAKLRFFLSLKKSSDKNKKFIINAIKNIPLLKALGILKISEDVYDPSQREDLKGLDTSAYHEVITDWDFIRSFFDFHIFYGGHTIFPSLSISRTPYAVYEHGTIRSIPFQGNNFGRLIKHAYENANVVMITNADYCNAKKRLEFDAQKIVYIPHGFDDTSCIDFLNKFKKCTDKNNIVKFFAPSRHDWVNGNDGNSKGNDIIVKAVKKLVDDRQTNFLVTMLEYGNDIRATKNLIQQLELKAYFEWKPTMIRKELWTFYLNSNAVLDQFYIPAIGQIGVETIALGVRLINADDGSMTKFFGERSPILAANTPEEVAKQMLNIMADPDDKLGVGDYGRAWFARNHSSDAIGSKLNRVIKLLES